VCPKGGLDAVEKRKISECVRNLNGLLLSLQVSVNSDRSLKYSVIFSNHPPVLNIHDNLPYGIKAM